MHASILLLYIITEIAKKDKSIPVVYRFASFVAEIVGLVQRK